jgi:hypothetical protein
MSNLLIKNKNLWKIEIANINTSLILLLLCIKLELRLLFITTFYAEFRISSKIITTFNTEF